MSSIILCNTGADSLSKIDLSSTKVDRISFNLSESPIGPHGIRAYQEKIFTANNYSDSISIFAGEKLVEEKCIKIGPKPNDCIKVNDKLYAICGESNNMVVYDLNEEKVLWELYTGNWPHSIDYCKTNNIILVSNLEENCTSVIEPDNCKIIKNLFTPEYPTKVRVSNNQKFIYICESYLGSDENGYLDVFLTSTFERVIRIAVGTSPIDLYEDELNIYVSNFTDGTISIINKNTYKVNNTLYVGGMPKAIIKYEDKIYVGDYLKGRLSIFQEYKLKKIIAIESEPNAMILF